MNRKSTFAALLAVVAISIIFGMVLGGRLNAPGVLHAAPKTASGVFPATTAEPSHTVTLPDFSEIASDTLPAVVGVQNTSFDKGGSEEEEGDSESETPQDDIFKWFFGPNGPKGRAHPQINPQMRGQRHVSSGSGFVITPDGYILTNNHVVEGATKLQVTLENGDRYSADVVGTDPMIDLGLIKIDTKGQKLPTLPLGDSDNLRVGQWVMAIGNPFSLEQTVTVGVVSGKKRQVNIGSTVPGLANFIQTDAAINFGNSGGPLIDGQGRVVGINTAIQRGEMAEGIGFAIPINEARKAAEELRTGGSVKRGYLGITMNPTAINDKAKSYYKLPDKDGVIVANVTPNEPAAKAGLKANDVIRKIDGEAVKNNQELLAMIASRKPGETVRLDVIRGGESVKLDVKLGNRPSFDGSEQQEPQPQDDDSAVPSSMEGMGIKVEAIPSSVRRQIRMGSDAPGVLIMAVDPESDAAEEGLMPQQVITSVDDKPLSSVAEWNRIIGQLKPGATVKLDVKTIGDRATANEIVFLTVPKTK